MKKIIISMSVILVAGFLYVAGPILEIIWLNMTTQTHLRVENNTLFMSGLINSKTPQQLIDVFEQHPNIAIVVMEEVDGSADDTANLKAATWISKKDLTFILYPDSLIASGGTDFFLAGKDRMVAPGAKVGVHSWQAGDITATDVPAGDILHQPYIDYYIAIGWTQEQAEKFYYFTINAAPADDIFWMTPEQIQEYDISTMVWSDER